MSVCRACEHRRVGDLNRKNPAWRSQRVLDNYRRCYAYLSEHPCVDCGIADIRVLQFDHVDRSTKKAAVSTMVGRAMAWTTIMEEIEKCEVRCANCHTIRTGIQFNWAKCGPYSPEEN